MQRPLGAQISHMLKDRGIDVIFGIPGVHNQEMYRGIEEAGITHVLARHEQGAGFMADGYARATGKPGVAYVITGPGLCNIMTPMGQAWSDSVPMLVISSCLDETAAIKGQLHQMKDQRAAAETVCDWSLEARTAEAAYVLIDRALVEFRMQRARPKHIQVPISVLQAPAPPPPPETGVVPRAGAEIRDGLIDPLLTAKRPLFILGGGAGQAGDAARDAMKKLGAACFETYAGRGVAASYALSFGSTLARPESQDIIRSADVVVLVGTELAETDLWRADSGLAGMTLQVDIDPSGLHPKTDRAVIARASEYFDRLLGAIEGHVPVAEWDEAGVRAATRRWKAQVAAERPGIVPVADALRKCLPDLTMIYSDMTQFAYAAKEVWPMEHSGFWHHPTGFGTLGYALPAAIGGAIARPDLPTMAIIGDYGFHYTMQELGVAVELGLSLPVILWDNGRLGEIEDSMVRAQIAPNAVVAHNPDFCKLAEAFGARAVAPQTLNGFQSAVRAAFKATGPTLIYLTPEISKRR
ncbi:thiamine pyrophosphate-binding protein [Roseobacter sp.]|uniref:thiamine pyrophosphate-binding protein n=1 Tax=Roseobacter sp. TaxID=1907202 RepID=UPI0025D04460|nr:thiamine pyrophosphate-binding protein [Roseobacter sp.]